MDHCRQEIAAIEAQNRAGHAEIEGLCLALADWSAEVATAARIGHRCATFGPRSLRRRRLGVWAKAAVTWAGRAGIAPEAEKPAAAGAGRARRRELA
jgi:hypothetical protein